MDWFAEIEDVMLNLDMENIIVNKAIILYWTKSNNTAENLFHWQLLSFVHSNSRPNS